MPRIITITASMHNLDQGGQQIHIPESDYLLQIERVAPCSEKQWNDESRNPFMSLRTQIVDGPVKSRPYSEILTMAPEGQFRVGRFLAGCGLSRLPEGKELSYEAFTRYCAALTQRLQGKPLGVYIADNEYQGKVTSQIVEFYPAEDYANRKGQMATPPAPSNGVSPVPAAPSGGNPLAAFQGALANLLPEAEGA